MPFVENVTTCQAGGKDWIIPLDVPGIELLTGGPFGPGNPVGPCGPGGPWGERQGRELD